MSDVQADIRHRQIIFHDDDKTPLSFVIELLHSVFKKQLADAFSFTEAIREHGKSSCGSYPRDIADELLEAARQRIDDAGHPLRITSRASSADDEVLETRCKLCGDLFSDRVSLKGNVTHVCDECMSDIARRLPKVVSKKQFGFAYQARAFHFADMPIDQLVRPSTASATSRFASPQC